MLLYSYKVVSHSSFLTICICNFTRTMLAVLDNNSSKKLKQVEVENDKITWKLKFHCEEAM